MVHAPAATQAPTLCPPIERFDGSRVNSDACTYFTAAIKSSAPRGTWFEVRGGGTPHRGVPKTIMSAVAIYYEFCHAFRQVYDLTCYCSSTVRVYHCRPWRLVLVPFLCTKSISISWRHVQLHLKFDRIRLYETCFGSPVAGLHRLGEPNNAGPFALVDLACHDRSRVDPVDRVHLGLRRSSPFRLARALPQHH